MKNAQILDITPDEYFALDRFSSSIAKLVVTKSPRHARAEHQDEVSKKPTRSMDFGSVAHHLVLGKGADYEPMRFDDWRTKDAKAAALAARDAGRIPIKQDDFERATAAAESVRVELVERGIVLDGQSELVIIWDEETPHGLVPCKAMLDHVWPELGRILDLKFPADASPVAIERSAENFGYAIQRAAYTRALTALDSTLAGRVDFLFCFCEQTSPHAVNLTRPDGMFRELGDQRWTRAVTTWAECLATDRWPAYGSGINQLSAPAWALAREPFEDAA